MRSKDLTLSASLIALYVAITIIGATTPFKFTALMLSALFGLFWNYFSLKQNICFQSVRFGYSFIKGIRLTPILVSVLKTESIAGLVFLDWINAISEGEFYAWGIKLLELTGKNDTSIPVFILHLVYSLLHCTMIPYVFFRYFKRIGIFKRLPSF